MNAVFGLLGLARRAGATVSGVDAIERAVRRHEVFLVLLASDASERSKRGIIGLCENSRITLLLPTRFEFLW